MPDRCSARDKDGNQCLRHASITRVSVKTGASVNLKLPDSVVVFLCQEHFQLLQDANETPAPETTPGIQVGIVDNQLVLLLTTESGEQVKTGFTTEQARYLANCIMHLCDQMRTGKILN